MDKQSKEMQELDVWLAENLMKWHTDISKSFYFDSRNRLGMSVVYWHPTTNIAQAFEVLSKFHYWELYGNDGEGYAGAVWDRKDRRRAVCEQDAPTLAICLAAKKAWENAT